MKGLLKTSKVVKVIELVESVDHVTGLHLAHHTQEAVNKISKTLSVRQELAHMSRCFSGFSQCEDRARLLAKGVAHYYEAQIRPLEPASIQLFLTFVTSLMLDYVLQGYWEEVKQKRGPGQEPDDAYFVEQLIGWLSGFDYQGRYHPCVPRRFSQPDPITLKTMRGEMMSVYDALSSPGVVCEDKKGQPFYFHMNIYAPDEKQKMISQTPYIRQDPEQFRYRKALPSEVAALKEAIAAAKETGQAGLDRIYLEPEKKEGMYDRCAVEVFCDFDKAIQHASFQPIKPLWKPPIKDHEDRLITLEGRIKQLGIFKVDTVNVLDGLKDRLRQLEVKVAAHGQQLKGLNDRVGKLEEPKKRLLQQENSALKGEVDTLREEMKTFKETNKTQSKKIEKLEEANVEQGKKIKKQDVKIKAIENTLRQYAIPVPEAKTKASNAAHSSSANNNHLDAATSNESAQETESSNSEAVSQNPSGLFGGSGAEVQESEASEDEDKEADSDSDSDKQYLQYH